MHNRLVRTIRDILSLMYQRLNWHLGSNIWSASSSELRTCLRIWSLAWRSTRTRIYRRLEDLPRDGGLRSGSWPRAWRSGLFPQAGLHGNTCGQRHGKRPPAVPSVASFKGTRLKVSLGADGLEAAGLRGDDPAFCVSFSAPWGTQEESVGHKTHRVKRLFQTAAFVLTARRVVKDAGILTGRSWVQGDVCESLWIMLNYFLNHHYVLIYSTFHPSFLLLLLFFFWSILSLYQSCVVWRRVPAVRYSGVCCRTGPALHRSRPCAWSAGSTRLGSPSSSS